MLMSVLPTVMARASSEVGNLNENERAVFEGARDWWSRFQQATSTAAKSEVIKSNLKSIRAIAQVYKDHGVEIFNERANFYAGQHVNDYTGADKDHAIRTISGGKIKKYMPPPEDPMLVAPAAAPGAAPAPSYDPFFKF